jgi:hypothetical protein
MGVRSSLSASRKKVLDVRNKAKDSKTVKHLFHGIFTVGHGTYFTVTFLEHGVSLLGSVCGFLALLTVSAVALGLEV